MDHTVQLAQQNPEVHAEFMKGHFVVQKSRRQFSLMAKEQAHCHGMLYRNIYAVLATAVGCEQPSQLVVLTFLARGFVIKLLSLYIIC